MDEEILIPLVAYGIPGAIVATAVAVFVRRFAKERAAAARAAEDRRAREIEVDAMLRRLRADPAMRVDVTGADAFFREKKGEVAWWGGVVIAKGARASDYEGGVLLVTDKRVAFNYTNPSRSDWSKPWASVVRWQSFGGERLEIDMNSGPAKVFVIGSKLGAPAHMDARVIALLMSRASGRR